MKIFRAIGALSAGRLGVLGYHARMLGCIAMAIACGKAVGAITTWLSVSDPMLRPLFRSLGWVLVAIGTSAMLATFILSIRRNHDLGRSGWWVLLTFVPVVNFFWLPYVWFYPGEPEANSHGEVPRPGRDERTLGRVGLAIFVISMIPSIIVNQIAAERRADGGDSRASVVDEPSAVHAPTAVATDKTLSHEEDLRRFTSADPGTVRRIDSRVDFQQLYTHAPLTLLLPSMDTSFRFEPDGRLSGRMVQPDGKLDIADLTWTWKERQLCHEGKISQEIIAANCGDAFHVPGVGLWITNMDGSTSDFYWLAR